MSTTFTTKELGQAAPAGARLSACILIVDNDPAKLKSASDVLEMTGYIVERASDERQVHAILRRFIPNLILLDLALPGIDSLAHNLLTDSRVRHVPIVALTEPERSGDAAQAEARYDGSIAIPVSKRQLAIRVAAFLVRGSARVSGRLPQA